MPYSIDGVALQNPTYAWRLKFVGPISGTQTSPYGTRSRSLIDFNTSGRDGTVQVRGFVTTPTVTFVITTPLSNYEKLMQLLQLGAALTVTTDATRSAVCELVAATPNVMTTAGNGLVEVTAVFRLPGVYWRDASNVTYGPTAITSSGQSVNVFAPSTAPVRDALVSVGGSITGLTVSASNSTFFTYSPNIPAGQFLTFDSTNGRAWTGSSAFTETTEVTASIANGRGPYFLELTGTSNPATTGSNLLVTYSSASGATITVRGKNAYNH